jgi:hypothetical protein
MPQLFHLYGQFLDRILVQDDYLLLSHLFVQLAEDSFRHDGLCSVNLCCVPEKLICPTVQRLLSALLLGGSYVMIF